MLEIFEQSPWLIPIIGIPFMYFVIKPIIEFLIEGGPPILPPPKKATRALKKLAVNGELTHFVKEYRRLNPDFSILDAKADFEYLRGGGEAQKSK